MKKTMIRCSIIFTALFCLFFGMYLYFRTELLETLSVTFGVTAYHFDVRMLIGYVIAFAVKREFDGSSIWFREKPFERKLYKLLKVKKWKSSMPTYNGDLFDIKKHTIGEIISAGCQAEIVHEVIIAFSFLPIVLCVWFDSDAVFIITSILAAMFDSVFVIMQRFNRPRMKRAIRINREERK